MQTTHYPTQQGQHFDTASLHQPGNGTLPLIHIVPGQPLEQCPQLNSRRMGQRLTDLADHVYLVADYAEPLPYSSLTVNLKFCVCDVHLLVHVFADIFSLEQGNVVLQEAEEVFISTSNFQPTSKFLALLDAAEKEAI